MVNLMWRSALRLRVMFGYSMSDNSNFSDVLKAVK